MEKKKEGFSPSNLWREEDSPANTTQLPDDERKATVLSFQAGYLLERSTKLIQSIWLGHSMVSPQPRSKPSQIFPREAFSDAPTPKLGPLITLLQP